MLARASWDPCLLSPALAKNTPTSEITRKNSSFCEGNLKLPSVVDPTHLPPLQKKYRKKGENRNERLEATVASVWLAV